MMNATQLKYARERANAIYRRRLEKLAASAKQSRELTANDKLNMMEAGSFTVDREQLRYGNWHSAILFPRPEDEVTADAQRVAEVALREEYDALVDKLVLGDAAEALDLIAAFEKAAGE